MRTKYEGTNVTLAIEKISGKNIHFFNGVTLPVKYADIIDFAVEHLHSFVDVTVKEGKIIAIKEVM